MTTMYSLNSGCSSTRKAYRKILKFMRSWYGMACLSPWDVVSVNNWPLDTSLGTKLHSAAASGGLLARYE